MLSPSSDVQHELEEKKRKLKQADDKRKATALEVGFDLLKSNPPSWW